MCVAWGSGTVLASNGLAAVAQALAGVASNLHDLDLRRSVHFNPFSLRHGLHYRLTD